MSYSFFLDDVLLPVTPSKLQLSVGNQNTTLSLINEGQVNILKLPSLTEVSFEMTIPQVRHNYAVYPNGFQPATVYLELLERLKVELKPFYFKVVRLSPAGKLLFDQELHVSLEEYKLTEDAKQGLDITVDVKLKQYKGFITKVTTVELDKETGELVAEVEEQRETNHAPSQESYTVASGDNLWSIAKRYLGDGSRYTEIAALNEIANPSLIYPGQVLLLP